VLGVVLLAAAAFNWPWCYRLTKIRWIEAVCGRLGVRLILALLGVGLIVLGLAIATDVGGRRASAATHHRIPVSPRHTWGIGVAWSGDHATTSSMVGRPCHN